MTEATPHLCEPYIQERWCFTTGRTVTPVVCYVSVLREDKQMDSYTMYANSGAENVTLSLNFMGRKLRNHTVAPAAKQRAWESTNLSRCDDEGGPAGSSRAVRAQPAVCVREDLPGSIPDLKEEVQRCRPCNVHNTHLGPESNTGD
ncbi:hypothetical protein SRHO_G00259670 [Serrasalmus rhombeus]